VAGAAGGLAAVGQWDGTPTTRWLRCEAGHGLASKPRNPGHPLALTRRTAVVGAANRSSSV